MTEPFLGEIKVIACPFAPRGYALCQGQLLAIQSNTALFSILGTTYGGNGTTTFALPDLRGRSSLGNGTGTGLTPYVLGEVVGEEIVTLLTTEMPSHTHAVNTRNFPANETPYSNVPTAGSFVSRFIYHSGSSAFGWAPTRATPVTLHPSSVTLTGGSQPHNNRQPYLALSYVIAMQGVFPTRN